MADSKISALTEAADLTGTPYLAGYNASGNRRFAGSLFAAASHTHAASDIASGTVATARLGSGTAGAGNWLRGDQTWAAPAFSAISGTAALSQGGTGASLSDPNADRIMFWDDSAGAVTWLTVGSGLSISTTTISATGGSADDWDIVSSSPTTTYQASSLTGNTLIKLTLGGNTAISPPTSSTFGSGKRFYVVYELTASGSARTPSFSSHTLAGGVTPLRAIQTTDAALRIVTYTDDDGSTWSIQGDWAFAQQVTITPDPVADYVLLSDEGSSGAIGKALAGDLMPIVTISTNTNLTKATHQGRRLIVATTGITLTYNASSDFDTGRGCEIFAVGFDVTVAASSATVNKASDLTLVIAANKAGAIIGTGTDTALLIGGLVPA